MRRLLNGIFDAAGALAAFFVFAIFFVMIGTSLFRVVGWRTGGFEDIVSWMTAAAAFFGMAHTFKHGDFVRVGLLLENLPAGARRGFEILSLIIGALFLVKRKVIEGFRPTLPPTDEMPPEVAIVTKSCWGRDPTARPSFRRIVQNLEEICKRLQSGGRAAS